MTRPDPMRTYIYIGGGGSLKKFHYEIEKNVEFGGYYFIAL